MKQFLRKVINQKTTFHLIIMTVFCVFLSLCRIIFTARLMYAFLLWNLFLAIVPWFTAKVIFDNKFGKKTETALMLLWLVFFPNAPYLLTDLIHLGKQPFAPRWFDLTLLLTYGFTGLFYGFESLKLIEEKIRGRFPKISPHILITVILYTASFGVYIGRFLRWNSWDILSNFIPLIKDVLFIISHPVQNAAAWGFTFLFGTLLNLMYMIEKKKFLP